MTAILDFLTRASYPDSIMACRPPTEQLRNSIQEGLNEPSMSLESAVLVEVDKEREDRFMPTHFVAAYIHGGSANGTAGLWAVGMTGGMSIFALNDAARRHSSWTAAAQPDSPIDRAMTRAADYPEAQEALDCL